MSEGGKPRLTRRGCLRLMAASAGVTVLGGVGGLAYVTRIEPRWHRIERLTIPVKGLPAAFEGFRFVQLSDIHIMESRSEAIAAHAVRVTMDLQPQLIVITGDYVTGDIPHDALVRVLRELDAPLGVWSSPGNHDHWTDIGEVLGILEESGIQSLINANLPLEREGDARLWFAGVDDIWEELDDLDRALDGIPEGEPIVLLAHEPDFADEVAPTERVSLQLSGHSHGGQVRLPGGTAPVLPYLGQKYPYGLRQLGEMWLYTHRGVGVIPPMVRLNCRPEITEITLVRAA